MNRVQRTAFLAFCLLTLMAFAGWLFGGKKSQPADAEPDVMTLDVSQTKTIWLLPEEQRKHYVNANRFRAEPVVNPYNPTGGRQAGGEVVGAKGRATTAIESAAQAGGANQAGVLSSRSVRVAQGQTLSHIALQELGDARRWRELAAFNHLGADGAVAFGQLLYLPEPGVEVVPPSHPQAGDTNVPLEASQELLTRQHTVVQGEFLGGISSRYYGTSKETARILAANHLKNADQIRAGQVLIIPPRD
jgi:nucleoid-associated protein YgaU